MSEQYIHVYNGTVNAGAKDGTKVDEKNPILAVVNATRNEEVVQEVALRARTGFSSYGNITLSLVGVNSAKWAIEVNGSKGEWGQPVVIEDQVIGDTNFIIKIHTKATNDESPANDKEVKLRHECDIQATT